MKKLSYLLMLPLALLFIQCGDGNGEDGNGTEETVDLGNVDEIDLNEYGYPLIINVPAASPNIPDPIIDVLDWGAIEIRVGTNYGIQISGGDGDMTLAKEDIAGNDVYEATYIVEEDDAILYGWAIRDTEMEPEYRFFVIIMDGNNAYEIRSIVDEPFSEGAALKMFNIAKAIQLQPAS